MYACPLLLQRRQPHRRAVWSRRLWSGQSGAFGARQHRHSSQWMQSWLRGCQEAGQAPLSPWRLQTLWRGQTPGQEVSTHTQNDNFMWCLDWKIKCDVQWQDVDHGHDSWNSPVQACFILIACVYVEEDRTVSWFDVICPSAVTTSASWWHQSTWIFLISPACRWIGPWGNTLSAFTWDECVT